MLDWARRADVPLLERLRYLCIVSSNLDEFFEVRAAPHLDGAAGRRPAGRVHASQSFEALAAAAHTLVDEQYTLYNDDLMPAFAQRRASQIVVARRTQRGAAAMGERRTSSARCGRC